MRCLLRLDRVASSGRCAELSVLGSERRRGTFVDELAWLRMASAVRDVTVVRHDKAEPSYPKAARCRLSRCRGFAMSKRARGELRIAARS